MSSTLFKQVGTSAAKRKVPETPDWSLLQINRLIGIMIKHEKRNPQKILQKQGCGNVHYSVKTFSQRTISPSVDHTIERVTERLLLIPQALLH